MDALGPAFQDLEERFVSADATLLKASFANLSKEEEELEVLLREKCSNNILFLTLAAPVLVNFEGKVTGDVSLGQCAVFHRNIESSGKN